jgi:hypothetical protein
VVWWCANTLRQVQVVPFLNLAKGTCTFSPI